ncbi:MAG: ribbon-helix-helix protein, CopG family [Dermatophilaceae bacterium]
MILGKDLPGGICTLEPRPARRRRTGREDGNSDVGHSPFQNGRLLHSSAEVLAVGNTGGYNSGMSKVMVSLPEDLLAEIDTEAKRRSTSRSALLASAARRELARRDPEKLTEAIARSVRRFDRAGTFDASDLVRDDRDSRR